MSPPWRRPAPCAISGDPGEREPLARVGALGGLIVTALAFPLGEGSGLGGPAPKVLDSGVRIGLVRGTPIEEGDTMGLIGGGIRCDDFTWLRSSRSLAEAIVPPPVAS